MLYFRRRQFGVYKVLLASFLLMLSLSAAANLLAALKSNQILMGEIERANDASLEALRMSFDDAFTVLQEWCTEVSLDTQINTLIAQQGERRSPQSPYLNVQVVKRLSEVRFASSYVSGLYLYLLEDDYVLTPDGKYSSEEYFQMLFSGGGELTLEAWKEMHAQPFFSQYETLSVDPSSAQRKSFLLYGLPVGAASQRSAVLGMELSIQNLNRLVTKSEWLSGAAVGIVDHAGNIISLGNEAAEGLLSRVQLHEGGARMQLEEIDGQKVYVTDIASGVNDWRYISLVPQAVYLRPRNTLIATFAAVLGATLAIGLALSLLLARAHARPVKRLVQMMDAPKFAGGYKDENEYAVLERSIVSVKRENWALSELNRGQESTMRRRFLKSLLQGTLVDEYEIEGVLRECGMRLQGDRYALALFDLSGAQGAAEARYGALEEALQARLFAQLDGTSVLLEDAACVILSVDAPAHARIRACLEAVIEAFETDNGPLVACVSTPQTDAGGIHAAYLECCELLEYTRLMGVHGVRFYEDMPGRSENKAVNILVAEEKVVNLLRAGQYPQAQKVLDEMLDETFSIGGMSIQAMKCNLYGLIYSLSRAIGTPQSAQQLPVLERLRPVERLMVCKSVQDLRREMNALLREMDEAVKASNPPRAEGAELLDGAAAFIQARYAQQDLSVSMVAEAMGVSPVAITRLFQRLLGMGTLDFIHHTRLQMAKQLLTGGERSIREIAELTGYNNSVTFIRVFKKYEGVTPGQYRENEQKR